MTGFLMSAAPLVGYSSSGSEDEAEAGDRVRPGAERPQSVSEEVFLGKGDWRGSELLSRGRKRGTG